MSEKLHIGDNKKLKKVVSIFLVLVFCITVFLFLRFIYSKIDKEIQVDYAKYSRYIANIDTPAKKWLNGHLGVFFRFRYFGNINWLVLPFIGYFLLTIKKRKKWQISLCFVYLTSVLLLGMRGYYWWRYQFTLFPFTIAIIMLLGWEYLKNKNSVTRISSFFLVVSLVLFNFYHYFDYYKFQWMNKKDILNKRYPNQVLKYIDDINDGDTDQKFLICSLSHIFFYHLNKSAIPYYNPEIKGRIQKLDREPLHQYLKNILNVKYIFSDWTFEQENKRMSIAEILALDCKKIVSDRGYQLYLLRDGLIEEGLEFKSYNEYKVWDSIAIPPEKTSSELEVQGIRGKFNFEFKKIKGGNILTVFNEKKGEEEERVIQFGYTLNNETIKVNSLHSKYVYFCVEINIPKHLINKDNYIFIQDFDGEWERLKTFYAAPRWRKYVVFKKIRPQSSKIGIGFKFQPKSEKDKLSIQNVKIYFLDQLL